VLLNVFSNTSQSDSKIPPLSGVTSNFQWRGLGKGLEAEPPAVWGHWRSGGKDFSVSKAPQPPEARVFGGEDPSAGRFF